MSKIKVYIAGKITGMEATKAYNNFKLAESALKQLGYEVVNPMDLPHDHDKSWESYMKECIVSLTTCDFIYLLPNWRSSKGAQLERLIATQLKIKNINRI